MRERAYRRYVLAMLTAVYMLNSLDSGLMTLLLQPIKGDLRLSDSELGFLTGIAFAVFYAILGLPFARWADRGNRATVTAVAIGLWGITVMSCLLVRNFSQLVCARIAAGVGESGCMPPTYSLIGDYFSGPAERTKALTVYWLANPIAALCSFICGGWLNERYGWRLTFFLMGLPALFVAVLVKATIRDPREFKTDASSPGQGAALPTVIRTIARQGSAVHLMVALVLLYTMGSGLGTWYGAFLIRSHGMSTAEAGLWLGTIFGACGTGGIALGGYVSARWFSEDARAQVRLSALTVAAAFPLLVLFLLLPEKAEALGALVPVIIVFTFYLGPTFALLQRLVPDDMRATTLAIVMLMTNLVGMGLGPITVGMLSDSFAHVFGIDSLRYAMLVVSLAGVWSAFHFWQAGRTIRRDIEETASHGRPRCESDRARVAYMEVSRAG